jgi:AcrR family transcriptional regulator
MSANTESLRDRQRARIRAEIRRAAYPLFIERGYDAVTTEEIAAAAGVSTSTFFRHVATKDELLLAPVRQGGAEVVQLLEERPGREPPDVALINAMVSRARTSFNEASSEEWREALLVAPDVFARVAMHTAADRERAVKLIAARMGADLAVDLRPGLLVQLAFAAADFAFREWVQQTAVKPKALYTYVAEALEAVRCRRWR